MSKWQACVVFCGTVLALAGSTSSDEPRVQSAPTSDKYYVVSANLRRGDPANKAAQKLLASPRVLIGGPLNGVTHSGQTIQIEGETIDAGTSFQARVQMADDEKLRVNFTLDLSSYRAENEQDPQSQVVEVTSSKWIGSVVVRPSVVSTVHCSGTGNDQTWLELRVDDGQALGLEVQFAPGSKAAAKTGVSPAPNDRQ